MLRRLTKSNERFRRGDARQVEGGINVGLPVASFLLVDKKGMKPMAPSVSSLSHLRV
jgi:hypothetical protein